MKHMYIKSNSIRLTLILFSLTLGFSSQAIHVGSTQLDTVKKDQPQAELKTLFSLKKGSGLKSLGFTAGPVVQFGQLGVQQGFNFAIHVNNQWSIGAGVLGNMRGGENRNMPTTSKPRQSFSGFQVEYTPKPNALIHVSFPLMIGRIRTEDPDILLIPNPQYNNNPPMGTQQPGFRKHDFDDDHRMFNRGPGALGIQPGVSLELNVFKYAKLFGAVNYRFAAGKNSTDDMKGVSGQIGLKLGIIDRSFKAKKNPKK
jgi:hypothetical protein